jgi:hypothetical protein
MGSMGATLTAVTAALEATAMSQPDDAGRARHGSPVVAFIIGLSIIILASILNAAGLNLTKLDHVSSSRFQQHEYLKRE